jgi:hypothetical protein
VQEKDERCEGRWWGRHLIGHEHEGGGEVDDVVGAIAVEHVVVEALVLEQHTLRNAVPAQQSKAHAGGGREHSGRRNK